MSSEAIKEQLDQFRTDFQRLRSEIGKVIVGQDDIVEGTLTALIAGGHVLLEGVPGLGKTLLVRTLSDALHLKFAQQIQFTPDLMPADLIGTNIVLDSADGGRKFEFQRGPVFANIVLADEINRATPKTQSAYMLEAMQENAETMLMARPAPSLPEPLLRHGDTSPLKNGRDIPLFPVPSWTFSSSCYLVQSLLHPPDMETILDRTTEAAKPKAEAVFDAARIMALAHNASKQIPIAQAVRALRDQLSSQSTHPRKNWLAAPVVNSRSLRQQPARGSGDSPGRETAGDSRRTLPRIPRRHPQHRSHGAAASVDFELRRTGREHRHR